MTATQTQIRRDSSTNLGAATPASGELGYDTTNKRLHIGDGTTAGGIKLPNYVDIQGQNFLSSDATGTNTITMTVSPAPASYVKYQRFVFKAQNTNTGAATINVNSLGAKTVKKKTLSGISDLAGGEILQDGVYSVVYDGTYLQLEGTPESQITQDYELLATATASSSSTLDFESLITSDYGAYDFVIRRLRPATDAANLLMRTSTNNGSSYDSSASNYGYNGTLHSLSGASSPTYGSTGDTAIELNGQQSGGGVGNLSSEGIDGVVTLVNPLNATARKCITFNMQYQTTLGEQILLIGGGTRLTTSDIDAVRFQFSSGNITSGSIDMYGRRI